MPSIQFSSLWILEYGQVVQVDSDSNKKTVINQNYLAMNGCSTDLESVLNQLDVVEDIVSRLLNIDGPWSVIYYRPDLNRLFVGRDVFGRQSIVWSTTNGSLLLSCSVHRQLAAEWHELPYAQVTAIDTLTLRAQMYSLLNKYPDDYDMAWITTLKDINDPNGIRPCPIVYTGQNDDLIRVCDKLLPDDGSDAAEHSLRLFDMLTETTRSDIDDNDEVCIAFSGGVDSLLVTYTVLRAAPITLHTVTLINVAFGEDDKACDAAPDRIRAVRALQHLRDNTPDHVKLRLLLRNVDSEELTSMRNQFIAKAAAPALSVLDDSLSCVVWFALEGSGREYGNSCTDILRSSASVYFMGSGADELYAGYARHRTRYERDGAASVAEECEAELRRLGSRNGGRDARVAAQLQRKLACPFLSDKIVAFSNKLPLSSKCDLSLPRGQGEKLIIRNILRSLGAAHDAPKQAMQFGSRMSKMSNSSKTIKGSDVSDHLRDLCHS